MSDDIRLDLTPDTHILQAQRNRPMRWPTIFGELIDNSLDAGANRIEITINPSKHSVRVVDDGHGCADISVMLCLGKHLRQSTTKLGRYGLGLKDAALALYGRTIIATVHANQCLRAIIDWANVEKSKVWEAIAYRESVEKAAEYGVAGGRGTAILFEHIEKPMPPSIPKLVEDLGYTFSPALHAGRQIVIVKGKQEFLISAFCPPPMTEQIEIDLDIDGRRVHLQAGIVAPGEHNSYPGFSIAYRHRIIESTLDPCGKYATNAFFAFVTLGEGWRLSTNKTSIQGDSQKLYVALFEACEGLLKKACASARTLRAQGLSQSVSIAITEAFNQFVDDSKAKRKPRSKEGTHSVMGSDRRQQSAAVIQPGTKRLLSGGENRRRKGIGHVEIRVEFASLYGHETGNVTGNPDGTLLVTLNTDHPAVDDCQKRGDEHGIRILAAALAAMRLADTTDGSGMRRLPGFEDKDIEGRFRLIMGRMLRPTLDQFLPLPTPVGHSNGSCEEGTTLQ